LERKIHPVVIISAFNRALEDAVKIVDEISVPIDTSNTEEMTKLIKATIGTKFVSRWSDLMCQLALHSVRCVAMDVNGKREVDIKRYVRIEKV
jgi:T-complex protein 1 subunit gamma